MTASSRQPAYTGYPPPVTGPEDADSSDAAGDEEGEPVTSCSAWGNDGPSRPGTNIGPAASLASGAAQLERDHLYVVGAGGG